MKSALGFRFMVLLLCVVLAAVAVSVPAQAQGYGQIGPSNGEIAGVIVGVVAGLVVIGIVVYYIVRKGHSVTGCAVSNQDGLALQNEDDHQTYLLIGDTTNIKAGYRIKVSGKKQKNASSGDRSFLVSS